MPRIILASSSRFRRALLRRLQLPFDVINPAVDESPRAGETPAQLVRRLAVSKAQDVAQRHEHALVIGSDQVAAQRRTIIGKPGNRQRALEQLRQASGRTVTLHTGLALVNSTTGRMQVDVIPYRVLFRNLSEAQIQRYLRKEQPYDCCGSLRAEGLGVALLERFQGDDPSALIGLPLIRLVTMLAAEGVKVP